MNNQPLPEVTDMTPHPTREALAEVLALCEKATAAKWRFKPFDGFNHHADEIAGITSKFKPMTAADMQASAAAVNFLRSHGPALLAMAGDAERYRWLRDLPSYAAEKAICPVKGQGVAIYQREALDRFIDTARQGAAMSPAAVDEGVRNA